jgi:hypothetical protein
VSSSVGFWDLPHVHLALDTVQSCSLLSIALELDSIKIKEKMFLRQAPLCSLG